MSRDNYFEGMYFRCVCGEDVIAFITAYHINDGNKSSSLQVITKDRSLYIPLENMELATNPLYIRAGKSVFSEKGIFLDIFYENINISGSISFGEIMPVGYDIMGPFRYVPFMQCRHSVFSMRHSVDGKIDICDREYVFDGGMGYIEGDRGCSFPEHYIWTECIHKDISLMLSVADIPLAGMKFTGIIGIIVVGNENHRIATYLGAKVKHISENEISVKQGRYEFTAKLINHTPHPLSAPENGSMNRTIHESAACEAYYRFTDKGRIVFEFTDSMAAFEFEYGVKK